MSEMNFSEGMALGRSMKGGLADDWLILMLFAILLGGSGRSDAEVTRKEFEELKAAVGAMRGGMSHAE